MSDVGERRTRLVSFLGTGRYEQTRHRFADGTEGSETPYVCRALAEHLRVDEIEIVATVEAEEAHRGQIGAELRAANLPTPDFHRIPKGEGEPELWQQFEVVKELLRPPSGTKVVFDITHAFRSQPFFAAATAGFVRAVDRDPASIQVFYAAFEGRQDGVTPVWELTPFIELVDWAQQMVLFLRTGRAGDIAERTERLGRELARRWAEVKEGERPNLDRLGRALREFGRNLETMRTGDLLLGNAVGSAAALSSAVQAARDSAKAIPPLADVLARLQEDMVKPLLGASEHLANEAGHRALSGLARLYLDMGRWAEAAAIVREGWITRYATPAAALGERNQRRPGVDEGARRDAEERWNEAEGDTARQIAAVRNDIEHAGFKQQPAPSEGLRQRLQKLVDEFAALPGIAEPRAAAGHPPVFINLSNHPSARWSPAQIEAARRFVPEIRDWPFPAVPPEADAAEIKNLAGQTTEQVLAALPGATHAMVQGEFTLVHALVRELQRRGIVCVSATTRRDVVEADGGVKTTRFEFVRFREFL
jgi:CRISPR-associated protein Csx16